MSQNQFIEAVKQLFADLYPKFTWEDFFLDDEKPVIDKILQDELAVASEPHEALHNILTLTGRL